jgi:ribosomal protein L13E
VYNFPGGSIGRSFFFIFLPENLTMRALILSLILFSFLQSFSQEKPDFHQMWTSQSDGKKFRVIQVMDDSVHIYNSDPTKLSLRYVQRYPTKKFVSNEKDGSGFLIYEKDSAGTITYRRLDYSGIDFDSVSICERSQIFNDVDLALNPAKAAEENKIFYTTEYFYYLKLARSAPDLKKEEYVSLLKTVSEELKKPEIKTKATQIAGKTTDQKLDNYLRSRIRNNPFSGKIFPANLAKAQKKYANDDAVKKLMQTIRPIFFVKPQDPTQKSKDTKTGPIATDKKTSKSTSKNDNP